jgi:hypothetical protein
MAKKQKELPGMEVPVIKEVVEAAEDYVDKRDKRMACTTKESAAQSHLMNMMEKNNLTEYVFDGQKATIVEGGKKVRVRQIPATEDSE